MEIVDANYILRYLLKDIEEQYLKATIVLEEKQICIPEVIIAEVVYVLQKVYKIPNKDISGSLAVLLSYSKLPAYTGWHRLSHWRHTPGH